MAEVSGVLGQLFVQVEVEFHEGMVGSDGHPRVGVRNTPLQHPETELILPQGVKCGSSGVNPEISTPCGQIVESLLQGCRVGIDFEVGFGDVDECG